MTFDQPAEWSGPAFGIDPARRGGVTAQLVAHLRGRIVSGALAPRSRLPSSRALADALGVSRSTVTQVFEQLCAEGLVTARPGAGVFVAADGDVELGSTPAPRSTTMRAETEGVRPPRPFAPGLPDLRLFPYGGWARAVGRAARTAPQALIESRDVFGDLELRRAIAAHLAEWRGFSPDPEQIAVTAGSVSGLALALQAVTKPGDAVGVEEPGWPALRRMAASLGREITPIVVGDQGAVPPATDVAQPRAVVLTPSHQFPLGGALPAPRRAAFLEWAERSGSWIVEDDYDSEYRYAGRPIPAMAGIRRGTRTLYLGSFSKIFWSGLRLGFLVAPPSLLGALRRLLEASETKAATVAQRPLALFMADGGFQRHLRRTRRVYGERRRALIEILERRFGRTSAVETLERAAAGMQLVWPLPEDVDDKARVQAAAADGLGCRPLSTTYAGRPLRSGLLLGFCATTPPEMEAAADALTRALSPR